MTKIDNCMIRDIITVDPDELLLSVLEIMRKKHIGAVLVGRTSVYTGIFTERDLLNQLNLQTLASLSTIKIKEIMTTKLICVDINESLDSVLSLMNEQHIRHTLIKENNKIVGIVSIRDILNRRIARFKGQFEAVFNNKVAGIICADENETIISCNRKSLKILGRPGDKLEGLQIKDVCPEYELAAKKISQNDRLKDSCYYETKVRSSSGKLIDIDVSISIIRDENNDVISTIAMIRDITVRKDKEREKEALYQKLKTTQNQLIQTQKIATIGQFSVGMAHEIKNPIAIILQSIEILKRKINNEDTSCSKYITMIANASARINTVITELLNFSRTAKLKKEPIDITELLDAAVSLISNKIKQKNIIVKTDYQSRLKTVYGDKILLEDVFVNILANASDAVNQGGEIKLNTSDLAPNDKQPQPQIKIDIIDNGSGISQSDIEHVFEPFFTTKKDVEGIGVGLSLVSLILEKQDGSITVTSKPNQETNFSVILPVFETQKD